LCSPAWFSFRFPPCYFRKGLPVIFLFFTYCSVICLCPLCFGITQSVFVFVLFIWSGVLVPFASRTLVSFRLHASKFFSLSPPPLAPKCETLLPWGARNRLPPQNQAPDVPPPHFPTPLADFFSFSFLQTPPLFVPKSSVHLFFRVKFIFKKTNPFFSHS